MLSNVAAEIAFGKGIQKLPRKAKALPQKMAR